MTSSISPAQPGAKPRGRLKLLLVLAVCAAPVIASYVMYYLVKPASRTNYSMLIEPQRPMPALRFQELDGTVHAPESLRGKWLMISVDGSECPKSCEDKLYHMRQVRLTTGKEKDRVERLWLVTDQSPLATLLIRQYDGMHILRADRAALSAWLPAPADGQLTDHIYLVDPLGNLMMRFPKNANPSETKKDLSRLLRASRVG